MINDNATEKVTLDSLINRRLPERIIKAVEETTITIAEAETIEEKRERNFVRITKEGIIIDIELHLSKTKFIGMVGAVFTFIWITSDIIHRYLPSRDALNKVISLLSQLFS